MMIPMHVTKNYTESLLWTLDYTVAKYIAIAIVNIDSLLLCGYNNVANSCMHIKRKMYMM